MDGDLDILSACQETKVFLQTENMTFQFLQSLPQEISDVEDMDGDSDPDFIYVSDTVGYYENTLVDE